MTFLHTSVVVVVAVVVSVDVVVVLVHPMQDQSQDPRFRNPHRFSDT